MSSRFGWAATFFWRVFAPTSRLHGGNAQIAEHSWGYAAQVRWLVLGLVLACAEGPRPAWAAVVPPTTTTPTLYYWGNGFGGPFTSREAACQDSAQYIYDTNGCQVGTSQWCMTGFFFWQVYPDGRVSPYDERVCQFEKLWDTGARGWYDGHTITTSSGTPTQGCPEGYTLLDGMCYRPDPIDERKALGDPSATNTCGIGNPINPATGNKYQAEQDYRAAGASPLGFTRYYNSSPLVAGARLGARWRSNLDARLVVNAGTSVTAVRADGREFVYHPASAGWVADGDVSDRLTEVKDAAGQTVGWQLRNSGDDSLESYDAAGRLIEIRPRQGLPTALSYSDGVSTSPPTGGTTEGTSTPLPAGLLVQAMDGASRTLRFRYDANSLLVEMTNPAGGRFQYAYDAGHRLASVTYPDASIRQYHYEDPRFPDALTGITDERGARYATWTYDDQGRAGSSAHAGGAGAVTLAQNPDGTATATDALGAARTYRFEVIHGLPKLVSQTQPPGSGCPAASQFLSYDANGNIASRMDFNANLRCYAYEPARNLETLRIEGVSGTCAAPVAMPESRAVRTTWWDQPAPGQPEPFRLPKLIEEYAGVSATGAALRTTEYAYDDRGNVTLKRVTDTSTALPRERTWTWTYTYSQALPGMLLRKVEDGPRTDIADVTTSDFYDESDACLGCRGNLKSITNALGQVTRIAVYDPHGRAMSVLDPNGLPITLAYDARDKLLTRDVGTERTTYVFDAAGNLLRVTLPDGSFLDYAYDAAQRLTGIADSLGNRVAYTLDALGNRAREDMFDPAGALARTRGQMFDSLNRLAQGVGAAGQSTHYAYDAQGNLTGVTDPLGRVTANAYDALNRLVRATNPAGGETRFDHDALDQLTAVTDPRGSATAYSRDALGNLAAQLSPDTGLTSHTHDAAGNVLTRTDANGQTTTYAYDALNRIVSARYADLSAVNYFYDQGPNGLGRLASIIETDPAGQPIRRTDYAHDAHGRVVAETRAIGGVAYTTAYGYDDAGRLVSLIYPSGRSVRYALNALGRIAEVSTTQDGATRVLASAIRYRPFGGLESLRFGNGQPYARSFDGDGRITGHTLGSRSQALHLDAASRITRIADPANPLQENSYSYDVLDRLTGYSRPGVSQGFSYDALGNRLNRSLGAALDTYAYDAASNRLASITSETGALRSFQHDANGSITGDGVNLFAYDARGRMVSAATTAGTVHYELNALGQRVAKMLPGSRSATETLLADGFNGPDGRPIDDQADGRWTGGGKKHAVARVRDGQALIEPTRRIRSRESFALEAGGLTFSARLLRGEVALQSRDTGISVAYDGIAVVAVKFETDGREHDEVEDDERDAKRRFIFHLPRAGFALSVRINLLPGQAQVRIVAGNETLDTGPVPLPSAHAGSRYRIRLGAAKAKRPPLPGRVDEVVLARAGAAAPAAIHYIYDTAGQLVAEHGGNGAVLREYLHLPATPLATIEGANTYYVHTDHLDTPRLLTDNAGNAVWRWESLPFGEAPPDEDPDGDGNRVTFNLRFSGQYFDAETNLHYNYFRDYDPATGRYMQSDPIGLDGGIGTYSYVGGNPLNWSDPLGLVYYCTAPLHTWPGGDLNGIGPFHHAFLCDSSGSVCGGQDRIGNGLLSPGRPSVGDRFNSDRCERLTDSDCINRCVIGKIQNPNRPTYTVLYNPIGSILAVLGVPVTQNCQDWARTTYLRCGLECSRN